MMSLDSTAGAITVICGGCGGHLSSPESGASDAVVASLQTSPPLCVVCSYRNVYCPRPESEVWETIIGLPPEGAQP